MALKKSYSSRFGTTHSNAYHKVTNISWNSSIQMSGALVEGEEYLHGNVSIYATEATRTASSGSLGSLSFRFEYDSDVDKSWVVQSYEHLKTLDDYEDDEDV